jgi:hypothetical protein
VTSTGKSEMYTIYERFFFACKEGNAELVQSLLESQELDDLNFLYLHYDEGRTTAFCIACKNGHIEVVKKLLADPRIDTNMIARLSTTTPFILACETGNIELVKLLMADIRTDITKISRAGMGDYTHRTALYFACKKGHIEIVKLLLSDGRIKINTRHAPFKIACVNNHKEICIILIKHILLKNINQDEISLKKYLAEELGITVAYLNDFLQESLHSIANLKTSLSGMLFALIIFLSDKFLQLNEQKSDNGKTRAALRFFKLITNLPMEIQMIICNFYGGVNQIFIRMEHSNNEFKALARILNEKDQLSATFSPELVQISSEWIECWDKYDGNLQRSVRYNEKINSEALTSASTSLPLYLGNRRTGLPEDVVRVNYRAQETPPPHAPPAYIEMNGNLLQQDESQRTCLQRRKSSSY